MTTKPANETERLQRMVDALLSLVKKSKTKKRKKAPAAPAVAPPPQLTELEQVQKDFEWLRSQGSVTRIRL